MNDWEQFLHEVSWFLESGQRAAAGTTHPWNRGPIAGLPELSALLEAASVTPVHVADDVYELLAWGPQDQRRGWLCRPPYETCGESVAEAHERFWEVCGGIIEMFGEPDTWWLNQNEVLTADATRIRVADVLAGYAWLWKDEGLEVSIDPGEYYAVAMEANGNLTLAHRNSGQLLLFAPDHAFNGVTPLVGSTPYSLLTIDHQPDLAAWIEVCATAWRTSN